MENTISMITTKCFEVHGPPDLISGDLEFKNSEVHALCGDFNVKYEPRPARRHNKIGSVESTNSPVRLLT